MPDLSQLQKLETRQVQIQTLTQKQILSLNILQLQKTELEQLMEKELEVNPVLEKAESETAETAEESVPDSVARKLEERIDYEWSRETEENGYLPSPKYGGEDEEKSFERFVSKGETLSDFLLRQLHLTVSANDLKIGEFIIGNLDRSGYFRMELSEAARYLDISEHAVEHVLFLIQELGPAGTGARDLKECLYLQYLDKEMDDELVLNIIQYHLEDLGRNKLKDIARRLRVTLEEVKHASDIIRSEFSPGPAIDEFIPDDNLYVPDPDVIVTEEDGVLNVELNEKGIPRLRKNTYYMKLLMENRGLRKETEKYLRERSSAAEEFISSIEKRRETLLSISNMIVERQGEFFFKGIRYLKPFTIKEVADRIGVHESTVSRAVNGKFMATPRGMFELRFFFSSGYTSSTGEDSSRESVKALLREVVGTEDRKHPHSDQKLVELLKARGVVLARRTVTKYREELGILSASKRKEF